jgi:hypothetical protein
MNKLFYYTLFAALGVISLASCKKNNLVVDKDVTPPAFVKFGTWNNSDSTATYTIKSTNASFKIPVGITNVSDKDRTINFTYSSPTAVQGQQYTAPSSLVIKAGQALDSLEIKGIFDGFNSITRVDKLTITISGGDVPVNQTKSHFVLSLKKYWEADLNAFSGVYIIQDYDAGVPDGDPYEVTLTPVSLNGPSSVVAISGLWGFDAPPVNVTLNWDNLETGKTTIPKANWFKHATYGQATINPNGTGTFSATDQTMKIGYEATVSAGSFGKYTSTLKKK